MDTALQNIRIQVGWVGFFVTLGVLIGLLFLRRLLPPDRRKAGRVTLILLTVSLLIRLSIGGLAMSSPDAANIAGLLALLLMSFGIAGVVAIGAFDILLARVHVHVPSLVRDILQGVVFAVIIIFVLRAAGVNPFGLITTSAVLTAIIGLALQSTISNLFAGLSLQVDRSIAVGDWISTGSRVGRIDEIKWRSTLLRTRDGDRLIVPNSNLLQSEVLNFSRPTSEHRVALKIGFGYQHPPNDVKAMLLESVRGVPGVLAEPAPDAFPIDFADSAVVYALRYWINDIQRESPIEGEVRTRIWYGAQRASIEIPFPIRTVFMNQVASDAAEQTAVRAMKERATALAKVMLFAPLEPSDLDLLAQAVRTVRFAKGEIIIRQGDPGDSLYLIQEGDVSVQLAVDGAEREVATLGAGKFFGEMSLMTGEPRKATCAAKNDVLCYVMDRHAFQHVLHVKPQIAEQVSMVLGKRQGELEGERENLSAEARARRAAENSSKLLSRIRDFFNLG